MDLSVQRAKSCTIEGDMQISQEPGSVFPSEFGPKHVQCGLCLTVSEMFSVRSRGDYLRCIFRAMCTVFHQLFYLLKKNRVKNEAYGVQQLGSNPTVRGQGLRGRVLA